MVEAWSSLLLMIVHLAVAPADVQFAVVAVAVLALALVLSGLLRHAASPRVTGVGVFARHGAGRAPTPAQSDPASPGHPRPRAPGSAARAV